MPHAPRTLKRDRDAQKYPVKEAFHSRSPINEPISQFFCIRGAPHSMQFQIRSAPSSKKSLRRCHPVAREETRGPQRSAISFLALQSVQISAEGRRSGHNSASFFSPLPIKECSSHLIPKKSLEKNWFHLKRPNFFFSPPVPGWTTQSTSSSRRSRPAPQDPLPPKVSLRSLPNRRSRQSPPPPKPRYRRATNPSPP